MGTEANSPFTVHLVSNASANIFSDNTLSSFINVLPRTINFKGQWEVALAEMVHSGILNNVTETKAKLYIPITNTDGTWSPKYRYQVESFDITPGVYESVDELLTHIRERCYLAKNDFTWTVNQQNGKISFVMKWGHFFSFPTDNIPNILGFKLNKHPKHDDPTILSDLSEYNIGDVDPDTTTDPERFDEESPLPVSDHVIITSDYPVDLLAGITSLFVYIDIISYQVVGDIEAPLLAVLPYDVKLTKDKKLNLDRPTKYYSRNLLDYKDLITGAIHTIRTEIRTDTGQLVPFANSSGGRTLLKLHFRPKPSNIK